MLARARVCVGVLLGALYTAGALRDSLIGEDESTNSIDQMGLHKSAVELLNRSGKLLNKPDVYDPYVRELTQAIVDVNNPDEQRRSQNLDKLMFQDFDDDDEPIQGHEGRVFVAAHIVGSCPYHNRLLVGPMRNLQCDAKVVTIAYKMAWPGPLIAYWTSPGELLERTRSRHVSKKSGCKNTAEEFSSLNNLFSKDEDDRFRIISGRVVISHPTTSEDLFVYLFYVSDFTLRTRLLHGWLLYQKNRSEQEFFRVRFDMDRHLHMTLTGEESRMVSFWPTEADVRV